MKEAVKEALCVREGFFVGDSFFFFAVWSFFDVASSHWRGVKHWFYATPGPNVYSIYICVCVLYIFKLQQI